MIRKRVLFVDDERAVLDGLQNLLRKDRKRWDMVFAAGANEALAELEKAPFDVVVSDMRMPGMDGAALLAKTRELYPATARIILSGHSERDAILRSLAVAHQFLGKPCEADHLRAVIERTSALHGMLADENIRRLVGKLERLPSVPRTYAELTEAVALPGTSVSEIADIVRRDPAMSTKILQLVNSAYFGLAQHISSIPQAVSYLGMELIKGLALTAGVFTTIEASSAPGFSLEDFQSSAVRTAQLARKMLPDPKRAEEAFTAALVHDIGELVLAMGLPDEVAAIAALGRSQRRPSFVLERERLGTTHAEVGAYLLGVWGLPFTVVETVAFHHRPSLVTEGPCDVLCAVHVADALVRIGAGTLPEDALDLAFVERAGLTRELPRWRELAEDDAAVPSRWGKAS